MSVSVDTIGGVTQLQDTIVSDSSGSSTTCNHETLTTCTPSLSASDHVIPTWSIIVIVLIAFIILCSAVLAGIGAGIYYCNKKSKSLISLVNSVQCVII